MSFSGYSGEAGPVVLFPGYMKHLCLIVPFIESRPSTSGASFTLGGIETCPRAVWIAHYGDPERNLATPVFPPCSGDILSNTGSAFTSMTLMAPPLSEQVPSTSL
jgi:hypothetical protein